MSAKIGKVSKKISKDIYYPIFYFFLFLRLN